jgi:hypothetical protein
MNIANLIEKPYTVFVIVPLALVPYSFKKKAIRGQGIEYKITAASWNYSRTSAGKQWTVEFNLPPLSLIRDTILSIARNCAKNFGDEDKDGE